jgi:hypothetical protein
MNFTALFALYLVQPRMGQRSSSLNQDKIWLLNKSLNSTSKLTPKPNAWALKWKTSEDSARFVLKQILSCVKHELQPYLAFRHNWEKPLRNPSLTWMPLDATRDWITSGWIVTTVWGCWLRSLMTSSWGDQSHRCMELRTRHPAYRCVCCIDLS